MEHQGVALDQLTPDIAAELVLRADWRGDRREYAAFTVRRFASYLSVLGLAKPSAPHRIAAAKLPPFRERLTLNFCFRRV